MEKRQVIYEWIKANNASQSEASEHFGVNQGYISRAVRSYAKIIGEKHKDKRRKE